MGRLRQEDDREYQAILVLNQDSISKNWNKTKKDILKLLFAYILNTGEANWETDFFCLGGENTYIVFKGIHQRFARTEGMAQR